MASTYPRPRTRSAVEEVYSLLGEKPKRQKCDGATGIVTEGEKVVKEAKDEAVRDVAIESALAKSEHYEIAGYRGLVIGARTMGNPNVAKLLQQICWQEEDMASRLENEAPRLLREASLKT